MNFITVDTWLVLGIIALIGLVVFFRKREAWGGLILGVFIGFAIAFINMAKGGSFNYSYVKTLIDNDRKGIEDNAYRIYQLVTLELWCRHYLSEQ